MTTSTRQRDVTRVDSPEFEGGMTDAHRVRPLVQPGDWAVSDPFLLLMDASIAATRSVRPTQSVRIPKILLKNPALSVSYRSFCVATARQEVARFHP